MLLANIWYVMHSRSSLVTFPLTPPLSRPFTILLFNLHHIQRFMLRDPELYTDPEEFIPERYMKEPGKPDPYDVSGIVFGFGRRLARSFTFARVL